MTEQQDIVHVLNDPEDFYPGNFDTPKRAVAYLLCLCQEAATEISSLRTTNAAQAEQLAKLEKQQVESAANVIGWCQKIEQLEAQLYSDDDAIGEVVIERMGIGDAQIVRFHMYKEIPPVGTKLYSRPLLQSSTPTEPRATVELTDEEIRKHFEAMYSEQLLRDGRILKRESDGAYYYRSVGADWEHFKAVWRMAERAHNQRQAVKAEPEDLTKENWPFPYQKTFNAIAEATHIDGGRIAVSVMKFRQSFGPLSAAQGVPEAVKQQWADTYAAFKGAFDTPMARRHDNSVYAQDSRIRMRDFNELMLSTAPEQAEIKEGKNG
jgi:hypothetical protein